MRIKKLHHIAVILSLATAGAAMAADYFVVVPVKGRTAAAPAEKITVSLSDYIFPAATVGVPYTGVDFHSVLQVTGDSAYTGSGVTFSLSSGALPQGLTLNPLTGVLSGTAQAETTASFDVTASYKGKSASKAYSLVARFNRVENVEGVRRWTDGTYAASCLAYKNGDATHKYEGDVGTGVYRVKPFGEPETDVYCDMTTSGGGWTLVMKGVAKTISAADWSAATGSLNAVNLQTPDYTGLSAKHSDAFINAVKAPGSVYKLEGYSAYFAVPIRYVSGSCVYNQTPMALSGFSAQRPGCDKTYGDLNLSSSLRTFNPANSGGLVGGITDSTYTYGQVTYTTSMSFSPSEIYYVVGTGGTLYYDRNDGTYKAGSDPLKSGGVGASFRMWVR